MGDFLRGIALLKPLDRWCPALIIGHPQFPKRALTSGSIG